MKTLTMAKGICIAMLLCIVLGAQAPADKPNFDKIVPDDVYGYVSLDNLTAIGDVFKKSFVNNLWNDPEVQKFVEKLTELMQKSFAEEVTKKTQITYKEITGLSEVFTGQMAFVLDRIELKAGKKKVSRICRDADGRPIFENEEKWQYKYEEVEVDTVEPMAHLVLLARLAGGKDKLENLIEKVCTSLTEEEEVYKKKDDYKGFPYYTFYKKKESLKLSYGYIDDIFFIAYGDKGFKRIIDNYKDAGQAKPLCDKSSYKKLLAEAGPNRLITAFVNCPPLISALKQWILKEAMGNAALTPESIDQMNKTADKVIELTGLGDLRAIATAYRFEGDGLVGVGFLDIPGAKRGIWKLLSSSATTEFKTLKAVPKDVLLYVGASLSTTEIWDEVMSVLSKVLPKEEFDMVNEAIGRAEEEVNLKFRDDILPVIGNEIAVIESMAPDFDPKNPFGGNSVPGIPLKVAFLVSIAQPDKCKQVYEQIVKKARDNGAFGLVEKQYEGFTFYVMEMPRFGPGGPEEGEPVEMLGYFFTKDAFVYGMPGSYLREIADAISGKNKGSLASDPDFNKVIAKNKVDAKKTVIAYADFGKFADLCFFMAQMGGGRFMKVSEPGKKLSDEEELLKLLPKPETIKKYLNKCREYVQYYPTQDGIMLRDYIKLTKE